MADKQPLIFIEHVLESIKNISLFTKGISKQEFFDNKEKNSAVIRQIEIIGEAVKNLPEEFRKKFKEIPWKDIAGMRDKLMHHYFGVDLNAVWKTVEEDIPLLEKQLVSILKEIKKS